MGEYWAKGRPWITAAIVVPLAIGMFIVARQTYAYSPQVELPSNASSNAWVNALLWVRHNTPETAVFAIDSRYFKDEGTDVHGFRAISERSALADYFKDGGVVSLFPALAPEWKQMSDATYGLNHFSLDDFGRLQQKYPFVTWTIVHGIPPSGLACPYQGTRLRSLPPRHTCSRVDSIAQDPDPVSTGTLEGFQTAPFLVIAPLCLRMVERCSRGAKPYTAISRRMRGCWLPSRLRWPSGSIANWCPSMPPAGRAALILWVLSGCAIAVAATTLVLVLRPIRQLSRDVKRIASGDLEHRTEWSSQGKSVDSFGVIADEMNRLAVRLRELRETEAGRRQMEFQLSDAVLHSIFEPIIVTDSKGHVLKLNQSAAEVLGVEAQGPERAQFVRPHGPGQPGQHPGRRQDPRSHPQCHLHAKSSRPRRRSSPAAHAHRRTRTELSPEKPPPCATPKAACSAPSLPSKTSPHCKTPIAFKTQFIAVASKKTARPHSFTFGKASTPSA